MVKLSDLPDYERQHLLSKNRPPLGPPVWTVRQKSLTHLRVALITTAGLHFRNDSAFNFTDATFRPIPGSSDANTLVMSHSSVNFDKTGFIEDINVVFPIDRLKELARDNKIGSAADIHYSFMGAGLEPEEFATSASKVAGLLRKDEVDAVFLTPV
jgi:D-proline reductase (dithiol) PrdB